MGVSGTGEQSATQLVARVRDREVSVAEVVEGCLTAIADGDEAIRAWEHVDAEGARARARALDTLAPEVARELPLLGVPVGVKDVFDTADMPTAYGSPIHRGRRPAADAAVVAALRAAGAVVVGKARTTEFACFHPTLTRNPLDPARTPGGSSSGSAAAVAAGMVPLALGTQTAGSVVRPASFCAVHGLKPTFGVLPRGGVLTLSETLDTMGLFARTPDDLARALDALVDPRFGRVSRPLTHAGLEGPAPRLGVLRWAWERLEPAARDAIDRLLATLADAGAAIEEVALPVGLDALADAQATIQAVESAVSLAGELERHAGALSERLRADLARGRAIGHDDYLAARRLADAQRWGCEAAIARFDAVLTPSTLGVPPVGLAATGDPLLCRPWTLLGTPSLAVPGAWTADGLPAGVQLATTSHDDRRLLDVARWVARHAPGGPTVREATAA